VIRRVDALDPWHCVHPCTHAVTVPVRAWRYAVVAGDVALALTVSPAGSLFALHRNFNLKGDDQTGREPSTVVATGPWDGSFGSFTLGVTVDGIATWGPCDLLRGGLCVADNHGPGDVLDDGTLAMRGENAALEFWAAHAEQEAARQPEAFWRALEAECRRWAKYARRRRKATRR
jgi:hypothetical protein